VVKTRFWFDRFPPKTLKWLSLPVPADPFWAARRGLEKRRAEKHSKHPEIIGFRFQRPCARRAIFGGKGMYAVIRAGGKQYRVAPGDVIRVEKLGTGTEGEVEFNEVLAVSGSEGEIARPQSEARVVGQVVEEGRGAKVLVFHYKRKKQYKKLRGHRQPFSAVRITEIAFDGQSFKAPELPKKEPKPKKLAAAEETEVTKETAPKGSAKKKAAKKSATKKAPAKKKK
jgi:large subunit ribosomal protein L21